MEFQILNPKGWCCESAAINMPENLENSAVNTGLEKVSFHSNPKEGQCQRMFKLPTIALISQAWNKNSPSYASIVNMKPTWTENFHMYKLDLQKAAEPETKLPTSTGLLKRQENSRKTSISTLLSMRKPLTVWITKNCGKFLKKWEYQGTFPPSCKTCMQVKKQQLEPNMEQWTGSKLGKEYVKTVYCHPAYLTYIQRTSCEMPGWMQHKLESRLWREIPITSDMQMTPHLWKKMKRI